MNGGLLTLYFMEDKLMRDSASTIIYLKNPSSRNHIEECLKYCAKKKWRVHHVFMGEEVNLKDALEAAENHGINIIVCWEIGDLGDSLEEAAKALHTIRNLGVNICIVKDGADTLTREGRAWFTGFIAAAGLERRLRRERARAGIRAAAEGLKWTNPHPPFGYSRDEEGRLIVNPAEAEVVKKIFMMYLEEKSMDQVAYRLNSEGLRTRKGGRWTAGVVGGILRNRIYIGEFNFAGVRRFVKEYAIIDREVFEEVQRLSQRFKSRGAERGKMQMERKVEKVERVIERFREALNSSGNPFHMKVPVEGSTESNMAFILSFMAELAFTLRLSRDILDAAVDIFRRLITKHMFKGWDLRVVAASIIYAAVKEAGMIGMLKKVAEAADIKPRKISRFYKIIQENLY